MKFLALLLALSSLALTVNSVTLSQRIFHRDADVSVSSFPFDGPGPSGTCGMENCGMNCTIPPMPTFAQLVADPFLNDPFTMMNGSRITTKAQWICRRAEINAQFQYWELGAKPPRPPVLYGTVSEQSISVTAGDGMTSINFVATVQLPTKGTAPYPAIFGIGGVSLNVNAIRAMGVAVINFNNNDIALQNDANSRGKGKFYTLYGVNHTAGAMMAWAWGVSRIIDVIEANGTKVFDLQHLAVSGCSRNGKGALVVGAFDERIALVIPQESGSGGSASWRISDWQGTTVQTLGEITGENVWFTLSLRQFNSAATKLPFDHHMLDGMVAPRGLIIIENTGMVWLGNQSCWGCSVAGHKIYEALGVPANMGTSQIGGHNHCAFPASQQPEIDAFFSQFMLGGTANTTVMKTDGGYKFDEAKWIDWTVPALQ